MNTKELKSLAESHKLVVAVTVLGFLIIAMVIFEAGVAVGFHRATFAGHWQDGYARDFGDPRRMMVLPNGTPNPNGAFGSVASVSLPTFVVSGKGEPEKTILIDNDTLIREGNVNGTSTDIVKGVMVTVIGKPNDNGQIDAAIIRIFPAAATTTP